MEKEIVIERKKSKSIMYSIGILLTILLFIIPIGLYFFEFKNISADVPLFIVILSIIIEPILIFTFIFYFKQIFNNKPVLIVNDKGIEPNLTYKPVGMIKWSDIIDFKTFGYMNDVDYITILLKDPKKYIKDEKRLKKVANYKYSSKWGHIQFTSMYFKKEFGNVVELMIYYLKLEKEIEEEL